MLDAQITPIAPGNHTCECDAAGLGLAVGREALAVGEEAPPTPVAAAVRVAVILAGHHAVLGHADRVVVVVLPAPLVLGRRHRRACEEGDRETETRSHAWKLEAPAHLVSSRLLKRNDDGRRRGLTGRDDEQHKKGAAQGGLPPSLHGGKQINDEVT